MDANSSTSPALEENDCWQQWGPYMSEREWGTIRETGGPEGHNWMRLPYSKAAQTAYRFCEDGIFGVCDRECGICHAYAFWNYHDDHLKERFFGVGNDQGAYGEDVKDIYHHKAANVGYRYLCADYLYPQTAYPYRHIVGMEKAIWETKCCSSIMDSSSDVVSVTDFSHWYEEQKYFEIEFEMTKLAPDELFFQLNVTNCSSERARVVVMPMLFLRNTWSAGSQISADVNVEKEIQCVDDKLIVKFKDADGNVTCFGYYYDSTVATPEILLTHNKSREESNSGDKQPTKGGQHFKDSFNRYIVAGDSSELIPNLIGAQATKAAICYKLNLGPKEQVKLRCFLMLLRPDTPAEVNWRGLVSKIEEVRVANIVNAYAALPTSLVPAEQDLLHAAYTNLLWNRQYYPLDCMPNLWNQALGHLPSRLVTVPDKWEQPYLATWDAALHCLCLNCADRQQALVEFMLLLALIRPDGSIYNDEFRPHGVTPPLIVLAAIDIYRKCSEQDKITLGPRIYAGLKSHLRWWLHRPDARGVPLIDGGICGVDYVSLFPRELVEIGEGLIWAVFFLLRFLELTLEIYATADIPLAREIELDLPDLVRQLGRLCSAFGKNLTQENGLYHPYWLDVNAVRGCTRSSCSSHVDPTGHNEAAISDDWEENSESSCGFRGHMNSPASMTSSSSSTSSASPTILATPARSASPVSSASGSLNDAESMEIQVGGFIRGKRRAKAIDYENKESRDGKPTSGKPTSDKPTSDKPTSDKPMSDKPTSDKQRCWWLHAYCYLPVICCCSLPNVSLQRSGAATAPTFRDLEELLAEIFNGPSCWETRAPYIYTSNKNKALFVSVLSCLQITELFEQLFNEIQFLSPYGIRTMSLMHAVDTATVRVTRPPSADNCASKDAVKRSWWQELKQNFCSGASVSCSYGGNTNWYGSVNLPYNYLVIEAIRKWSTVLHRKFDMVEFPSYSGRFLLLRDVVRDLATRNIALFMPNSNGIIPSTGNDGRFGLLFFETFNGDTGKGYGARHKGGWSAIIARILMLIHDV